MRRNARGQGDAIPSQVSASKLGTIAHTLGNTILWCSLCGSLSVRVFHRCGLVCCRLTRKIFVGQYAPLKTGKSWEILIQPIGRFLKAVTFWR